MNTGPGSLLLFICACACFTTFLSYFSLGWLDNNANGHVKRLHGDYGEDPRTFIVIPCGTTALLIAVIALARLYIRDDPVATTSFYALSGAWLVHLIALLYQCTLQYGAIPRPDFPDEGIYINIFMVMIIALQMIQMFDSSLSPIFRLRQHLTPLTIFVVGRLLLVLRTIVNFFDASNTFKRYNRVQRQTPEEIFNDFTVFTCSICLVFCLIKELESILTHFLGHIQRKLVVWLGSVAALCSVYVAVMAWHDLPSSHANYDTVVSCIIMAPLMLVHGGKRMSHTLPYFHSKV